MNRNDAYRPSAEPDTDAHFDDFDEFEDFDYEHETLDFDQQRFDVAIGAGCSDDDAALARCLEEFGFTD